MPDSMAFGREGAASGGEGAPGDLAERPRHELRLLGPGQSASALGPEGRAGNLGRESTEAGTPEVAIIAGCFGRLAHVSP
jgi:hypothetical protein